MAGSAQVASMLSRPATTSLCGCAPSPTGPSPCAYRPRLTWPRGKAIRTGGRPADHEGAGGAGTPDREERALADAGADADIREWNDTVITALHRRAAAVPTIVWYVTGLWLVLLLGASVLWPMGFGYDELNHIDMSYVYSAHPFHFYGPGQLNETRASYGIRGLIPLDPVGRLATVPILPRGQRPSLRQLGGAVVVSGYSPNQMVQHPPLYYWIEAALLRVPGVTSLAWDQTVWLMRLVSVALMTPVPLLCWATTRRMLVGRQGPHSRGDATGGVVTAEVAPRLAVIGAVLPLTVPNMVRDGSAVTNDSLLVLTTSVLLYCLSRVLTGDLSRRTAVWVAVSLGAALLTKGFALVLPPIVLAAYLFGWWRRPGASPRFRTLWPPLAIAAVGGVVGGLWWLRNVVEYGTVEINGPGPKFDYVVYGQPDHSGTLGHFLPSFVTGFVERIWGGVGLPDVPDPGPFVEYGWFVVVADRRGGGAGHAGESRWKGPCRPTDVVDGPHGDGRGGRFVPRLLPVVERAPGCPGSLHLQHHRGDCVGRHRRMDPVVPPPDPRHLRSAGPVRSRRDERRGVAPAVAQLVRTDVDPCDLERAPG